MRNSVRFALISFWIPILVPASVLDYLSEKTYTLFYQEKCAPLESGVVIKVRNEGKRERCSPALFSRALSIKPSDIESVTENLFFSFASKELNEALICERQKIEDIKSDSSFLLEDIRKKAPLIKAINEESRLKLHQVALLIDSLQSPITRFGPKGKKIKSEIERLNSDLEILVEKKNQIFASIPFGNYRELQDLIDETDAKDLVQPKKATPLLSKALVKISNSIDSDLKFLSKIGEEEKQTGTFPRSFKEAAVHNSSLLVRIGEKLKLESHEFNNLRCKLDAKYGRGTDSLATAVGVGSLATAGVAGILSRLSLVGRAAKSSAIARAGLIGGGAAASVLGGADLSMQIKKECAGKYKNQPEFVSGKNMCSVENVKRTLTEDNCALSLLLPSLATGVAGLTVSKAIREFIEDYRIKASLRLPRLPKVTKDYHQEYVDLMRKGNVVKARGLERKIKDILTTGEMKALRDVGIGKNGAKVVQFPDGTLGIWKPNIGRDIDPGSGQQVTYDSAKGELLSYELDRFLGYNRVPTTVPRSLNGEAGTVQLLVGNAKGRPVEAMPNVTSLFDRITFNFDRTRSNFLPTTNGEIANIDNGVAFNLHLNQNPRVVSDFNARVRHYLKNDDLKSKDDIWGDFMDSAAEYELGSASGKSRSEVVQDLSILVGEKKIYTKLKKTTNTQWQKFFRGKLDEREFKEFIRRKDEVVETIEQAMKEYGDDVFQSGPTSHLLEVTN